MLGTWWIPNGIRSLFRTPYTPAIPALGQRSLVALLIAFESKYSPYPIQGKTTAQKIPKPVITIIARTTASLRPPKNDSTLGSSTSLNLLYTQATSAPETKPLRTFDDRMLSYLSPNISPNPTLSPTSLTCP